MRLSFVWDSFWNCRYNSQKLINCDCIPYHVLIENKRPRVGGSHLNMSVMKGKQRARRGI
jgi:hypothetical protein